MIVTSRAGLRVELPEEQFMGKEKTLTLAGRIYKARRWMEMLKSRDSLLRLMDKVNETRESLGLPERGLAVANDPMRSLDEVTESDLEWISGIAEWCPDWKISAPPRWGESRG